MAAFPVEADSVLRSVGTKLALALFYKHFGFPAGPEYWIESHWTQSADRKTLETWRVLADDLGGIVVGNRPNVELGNLFRYRWSKSTRDHPDIFAAICVFGEGLAMMLIVSELAYWGSEEERLAVRCKDWSAKNYPPGWY